MTARPRPRLEAIAEGARRAMLRSGRGPLAGLWSLAYRLAARCVAACLRLGHPRSAAYVRGGLADGDLVPGVSDIDLVVVTAPRPGRPGEARAAIRRRFDLLCALVEPLRQLVYPAVYEDADLERAVAGSPALCPPAGGATGVDGIAPPPRVDPAELAVRPGTTGPTRDWRRIAGRDRLPSVPELDRQRLRVAAWLELQYWWRYAIEASARPAGPRGAYLCFKLVSEPVRILLWLTHGERFADRRAALHRAAELIPEEDEALRFALDLHAALPRSPAPPLAEALAHLVRLSSRIAALLAREVEPAGTTEVQLDWGGEDELAVGPRARDPLRALLGGEPALLPLADWRALARPERPDETFAAIPGSPADPAALGAAAVAGRTGPYPCLSAERLLVLATAAVPGRARLRGVHCPLSDPVSFALLDGSDTASFPDLAGWSVRDIAARAVESHRGALAAGTARRGIDVLSALLTAARAGLLAESVARGSPRLPLTLAAVAAELDSRAARDRGAGRTAYESYSAARARGGEPRSTTVDALRDRVIALPAYAISAERLAPPHGSGPRRLVAAANRGEEEARDRARRRAGGV